MTIVLWGEGQQYQRKVEWRTANKYLDGKPTGTELHPRHMQKVIIKRHLDLVNVQFHRFIKGEHGIYAVHSKQLAAGTYGCVYYCEDIQGIPWVLKVTDPISKREVSLLKNVGLRGAFKLSLKGVEGKYGQISSYRGITIGDYLKLKNPTGSAGITEDEQYNLAIKIARAVHQFHCGRLSNDNKKYAHLDLKPENICINKEGLVQLVDFDFAEEIKKEGLRKAKGSPYYIYRYIEIGMSQVRLDLFALLRILYLPKKLFIYGHRKEKVVRGSRIQYVFSDNVIDKNESLRDFLDTSNGGFVNFQGDDTAIKIVCRLIFYRHNINDEELINKVMRKPEQFNKYYMLLEKYGLNEEKHIRALCKNRSKFIERVLVVSKRLGELNLSQNRHLELALTETDYDAINKIESNKILLQFLEKIRMKILSEFISSDDGESSNVRKGGKRYICDGVSVIVPHGIIAILDLLDNKTLLLDQPSLILDRCQKIVSMKSKGLSYFRTTKTRVFYTQILGLINDFIASVGSDHERESESDKRQCNEDDNTRPPRI
jgi:serine/threonine protein kinase